MTRDRAKQHEPPTSPGRDRGTNPIEGNPMTYADRHAKLTEQAAYRRRAVALGVSALLAPYSRPVSIPTQRVSSESTTRVTA